MGRRAKKPKLASFAHQTALAHPCGSAHSVQPTALVQMDLPELDTVLLGENKKKNRKIYVNSALLGQPQRASLTEPSFKCSPERERAVNIPHIFHPFLPRLKYK